LVYSVSFNDFLLPVSCNRVPVDVVLKQSQEIAIIEEIISERLFLSSLKALTGLFMWIKQ